MLAAVREARRLKAATVVAAAPVTSGDAQTLLCAEADHMVTLCIAGDLSSVGEWYDDFEQVSDSDVCELLAGSGLGQTSTA